MQNPAYQQVGQRMLCATTWDGTMLVFMVNHQDQGDMPVPSQCTQQFAQNVQCPILGMCWRADQMGVLLACADNSIRLFNLQANQLQQVGQHNAPVKDVASIMTPTG